MSWIKCYMLLTLANYVIDLLSYPSGIAIPSPVVQLWSLISKPCNSQPSEFCKTQKERAVSVLVPESWGPTHNSLNASDSIEVAQDNECVLAGGY